MKEYDYDDTLGELFKEAMHKSFIDMMKDSQLTETTNGAMQYKTSGYELVDLNFSIPKLRNMVSNTYRDYYSISEADKFINETVDKFMLSLQEDANHTLKWLMYLRDIKQGAGERESFRMFLLKLAEKYPNLAKEFIRVTEPWNYGRWDDILGLLKNEELKETITTIIRDQLANDMSNYKAGKSVSLLAKWLPSGNTSSKETKTLAHTVREALGLTHRQYRKMLSTLRKHINIVETNLTDKTYNNINYEQVPSNANLKYKNAFYRNDRERRLLYLDALKAGKVSMKVNNLFLYEIITKYRAESELDVVYEAMWEKQEKLSGFEDTLVIRDGSGSMTVPAFGNSNTTCLDIADSLTLYCSQYNTGMYKDKFITFSSHPEVVDLSKCTTLHDKLETLRHYNDYTNTDLEKVFNMILTAAIKNNVKQEELPKQILIISDMQFDSAVGANFTRYNTLLEGVAKVFEEHGYKLPKLIFWNVAQYTGVPMQQNDNGLVLISGFSKNMFSMMLNNEIDPKKALYTELDAKCSIVDTMKTFELK